MQVGASRLRLTRRGRLVVTLLATMPVSVAGVMLASTAGAAATGAMSETAPASSVVVSASLTSEARDYVQVQSGDSLWSIAESSVPGVDPRDVVEDLIDANGLAGYELYPGQRLVIPTGY